MAWRAPSTLRRGSPSTAATAKVWRGSRFPGMARKVGGFRVSPGGLGVVSQGFTGVSWWLLGSSHGFLKCHSVLGSSQGDLRSRGFFLFLSPCVFLVILCFYGIFSWFFFFLCLHDFVLVFWGGSLGVLEPSHGFGGCFTWVFEVFSCFYGVFSWFYGLSLYFWWSPH